MSKRKSVEELENQLQKKLAKCESSVKTLKAQQDQQFAKCESRIKTLEDQLHQQLAKNESSEKTLEDQLHEQLAENNNNRVSTFLSFIVGIIALFGFYGFVYVNTCKREWRFNIDEFLLMSFVTIGILFFLTILVLDLGYAFRRDQFVVDNIRKKRYEESGKNIDKIFGEKSSNSNKSYFADRKEPCDFLPNFYNLFYWLFFLSEIFIGIITIKKVVFIFIYKHSLLNCKNLIYLLLFFISCIIFIILSERFKRCYYKKYKDRDKQFQTSNLPINAVTK